MIHSMASLTLVITELQIWWTLRGEQAKMQRESEGEGEGEGENEGQARLGDEAAKTSRGPRRWYV